MPQARALIEEYSRRRRSLLYSGSHIIDFCCNFEEFLLVIKGQGLSFNMTDFNKPDTKLNDDLELSTDHVEEELIIKTYELTLEELYTGKEINWPSESEATCARCGGLGKVLQPYSYRRDSSCYSCKGSGKRIIMRNLKFQIPAGAEDEYEREIKGIGIPPKNILIRVRQKDHSHFVREGSDLFLSLQITFVEAICGFQKVVKMLDGRKLVFSPSQGTVTAPDSVKCVENEGFPVRGKPCYKGKLYIQFKVGLPNLAPDVAEKVAEILGTGDEENIDNKDLDGIEVQLQPVAVC